MSVRVRVPIRLGPLATIPVDIESSADSEPTFSNVCTDGHDASRVGQTLACKTCGGTGPFAKGREEGGRLVVLTDTDLAATAVDPDLKASIVLTAHPRADVDKRTIVGDKPYMLKPNKADRDGQGYALLRHLIDTNPGTAFASVFAAKGKPAMYTFGTYHGVITMQKLVWPEDMRDLPAVPEAAPDADLVELGQQLITQITGEFDPAVYRDAQRVAREELVQSRVATATPVPDAAPTAAPGNVTSLLDALSRSIEQAAPAKPKRKRAPRKPRTTSTTPAPVAQSA